MPPLLRTTLRLQDRAREHGPGALGITRPASAVGVERRPVAAVRGRRQTTAEGSCRTALRSAASPVDLVDQHPTSVSRRTNASGVSRRAVVEPGAAEPDRKQGCLCTARARDGRRAARPYQCIDRGRAGLTSGAEPGRVPDRLAIDGKVMGRRGPSARSGGYDSHPWRAVPGAARPVRRASVPRRCARGTSPTTARLRVSERRVGQAGGSAGDAGRFLKRPVVARARRAGGQTRVSAPCSGAGSGRRWCGKRGATARRPGVSAQPGARRHTTLRSARRLAHSSLRGDLGPLWPGRTARCRCSGRRPSRGGRRRGWRCTSRPTTWSARGKGDARRRAGRGDGR